LKIVPLCPFVHAQFKRHPEEYNDVWMKEGSENIKKGKIPNQFLHSFFYAFFHLLILLSITTINKNTTMKLITGLHHVTAITGNAQENIDFYTGVLGLRLVKKR
jgi:hypothetical protein